MKPLQLLAAAALLLFGGSGCHSKREPGADQSSPLPPLRVSVQKAEAKSRPMTEEVVATVRAKVRATLEAKLNGRIDQMPIALGDKVQKGQLIARLDAGEVVARLEQAEAALDQAERDWRRVSGLLEQHGATQSEFDAANSRLRVAKGAVAEARAMKSYAEISAPFDGVITKKLADAGDLAVPGKPLIEIENPSTLQLDTDIPEAIADRIKRGAELTIHGGSAAVEVTGIVSELAPSADPASRTFRVKLDLPDSSALRSGQFARLIVPLGERISLRVPVSAVVQRGQMEILFEVEHQRARMHLVKTGKRIGDEIEILSGLAPGASVIVSEVAQLTDGQPVEVR